MSRDVPPDRSDPWERYGWIMASVWLLFLAFPLVATFTADRSAASRAIAVGGIVAFAGIYVWGLVRADVTEFQQHAERRGVFALVGLVALTGLVGTVIGEEALGMAPFLVSFAIFVLPLRHGIWFTAACLAATVVIPIVAGEPVASLLFGLITLSVALGTGTVRILDNRSKASRLHAEELALVTERDRVARDVHDVLGHSLTVVHVKAQLAERLVTDDPDRATAELQEIQALARQSLAEIRSTVAGLRMPRLEEELVAAERVLTGAGIAAQFPDAADRVDPRHRPVLAWALREAVTNVVRHSEANGCTVELASDRLVVCDDGKGIVTSTEGNGLRGLRERVEAVGGTLTLDQAPAGGTRLEVRL